MVNRGPATGENTSEGVSYETFTRTHLARMAEAANVMLPPKIVLADVPPLLAFVYRDRWVVGCDCGGDVSMAWRSGPHAYMCTACWNAGTGGEYRPYVFPAERRAIVLALAARRLPRTRNWMPTETVADLLAENECNGEGAA